MPSPRSRFESACRIGAFALLGWLLGGSFIGSTVRRVEHVQACDKNLSPCDKNLSARLAELSRTSEAVAIHLDATSAPAPWATDWLAALAHADVAAAHSVSWSGAPAAVAMSVQPVPDPRRGARIDIAAPTGARVRLRDDASDIDSAQVMDLGVTLTTPLVVGALRADVGGQSVIANTHDTSSIRGVLVVGAAGWEGKFIVSALEERGWRVVTRFVVAPGADVTGGGAAPLDTNRFAAVIAIDSTAQAMSGAIERFVRSGGGLVLVGPAANARAFSELAAGSAGVRTRPRVQANDTIRLGTTGFYPVARLRPGALALERRGDAIVVAARRVRAGRVMQIGYDDTWRWRMAGEAGSEEA